MRGGRTPSTQAVPGSLSFPFAQGWAGCDLLPSDLQKWPLPLAPSLLSLESQESAWWMLCQVSEPYVSHPTPRLGTRVSGEGSPLLPDLGPLLLLEGTRTKFKVLRLPQSPRAPAVPLCVAYTLSWAAWGISE